MDTSKSKIAFDEAKKYALGLVTGGVALADGVVEQQRIDDDDREHDRRHERQLPVHKRHAHEREHDHCHSAEHGDELLFKEGLDTLNVRGAALDDIAGGVILVPGKSGDDGEFSDFFESMFGSRRGGGGRSNHGFRGQDYTAELHLSLMDAAKTHKQVITVNGKNLRITVPAGVANGQTIKLKGQGGPGMNGGPAGDLYITFIIPDDSRFKRVGDDLYLTVPLNLYTAVLGGEQIIDTLDSKVKLKVKPGTQNNTKVRLKGKGFPVYKKEGQFGDLIVTYSIEVPTNLTEKQKELFREIQSLN